MSEHDPSRPDDRDLDDGGLDLTPRDTDRTAGSSGGFRRRGAVVVLIVLVVALGGVAWAARELGADVRLVKHVSDAADEGAMDWPSLVERSALALGEWCRLNL